MPIYRGLNTGLEGLKASDRTEEEKQVIQEQNNAKKQAVQTAPVQPVKPVTTKIPKGAKIDVAAVGGKKDDSLSARIKVAGQRLKEFDNLYKEALSEYEAKYGVGRNTVNESANQLIDNISRKYSSHYKRYYGTNKLPEGSFDRKKLAAEYMANKAARGEDYANMWLDDQYKRIVGTNQSMFEQATNSLGHLIPAIEGGTVQIAGNIYGSIISPALKIINKEWGLEDNEDLNAWDNYWDQTLDNAVTRLGKDIEHSGASYIGQGITNLLGITDESASERIQATKNSATKYNPEGIGDDAIIATPEQERYYFNSTTPWQALYSGGFTALSMMTGAALAKGSMMAFNYAAKGASYLNSINKIIKTEQALEKTLRGLKYVQQGVNTYIVPGLVGGTEGMVEGLQTKLQVEQDGTRNLNEFYKGLVEQEVNAIWETEKDKPVTYTKVKDEKGGERLVKTGGKNRAQIYQEVWNKYKDEYLDSRRHIEVAASKAGQYNFWANSLINGMLNQTLKAGLQAAPVQESIRNSKLWRWAYRNPGFQIVDDVARKKFSKFGTVMKVLKEPAGEGLEEYLQSVSNDAMSGAAENNITEFIKARFDVDATAMIGDQFSSDWSAALTALNQSLTDKNSIESAILGALGSVMGTIAKPGSSYHRGEDGRLEEYSVFNPKNYKRNLRADGTQESYWDVAKRITPWRSSVVSAYRERKREMDEADEAAKYITEWLRDPKNKEKWDGLTGTAYWMSQMHRAAESNDQFSYRRAEMGKAINDAITLSKIKGTDFYDTLIKQLQNSAAMDVTSEEGQAIIESVRNSLGEEAQNKTDEEILETVKSNANKMLSILSQVEEESDNLDSMLGRIDTDTRQGLIFGRIMKNYFTELKGEYEERINNARGNIKNSRAASSTSLDDDLKALIIKHGSINQAIKAYEALVDKKDKAEARIKELEAIDESKISDKQKEELEGKKNEIKTIDKQLKDFKGLNQKNEKGKRIEGTIDKENLESIVLNEQEIMDLDPRTRAMVIAQGSNKFYNATHQNRQNIDALNQQIAEIQDKIEAIESKIKGWSDENGRVRKGHNKQVEKAKKAIEKLQKEKYSKERDLQVEKGELDDKPVYSEEQQAVIDNILQQGSAVSETFLDDVVDMARAEQMVQNYYSQVREVFTDPNAFKNYVQKARYNASLDIARRRASWVSDIEDYKEFAKELDKITANASEAELYTIFGTLRELDNKKKRQRRENKELERINAALNEDESTNIEEDNSVEVTPVVINDEGTETTATEENNGDIVTNDNSENTESTTSNETSENEVKSQEETKEDENAPISTEEEIIEEDNKEEENKEEEEEKEEEEKETNLDKYLKNQRKQEEIIAQATKNNTLSHNDISLLVDALQYLAQNGIEVTNREEAVEALLEKDDAGNLGGRFRQWVEEKNESMPVQQRTHMPVYTSIGQIVSQYVELLNGREADLINNTTVTPGVAPIEIVTDDNSIEETPPQEGVPQEKSPKKPSLLDRGSTTPEGGHFVDKEGTVASDAIENAGKEEERKKAIEEDRNKETGNSEPTSVEEAFLKVTTPQIARYMNLIDGVLRSMTFVEEGKTLPITQKEVAKVKELLTSVATESDETFDTLDEVIDAILEKANWAQEMQDMMEEENDKLFEHCAIALKAFTKRLKVQSGRQRPVDKKEKRKPSPTSSTIHTADIAYLEQNYPDAWAVQFTNDHAIDEYNREHTIPKDTPIFFITNSEWTAQVTSQMASNKNGKTYNTLVDMPIVAAIEVEEPKPSDVVTAIKIGDKWYQPIGIMPSNTSKVSGAERMFTIRQLASKEQGVHLITANGLPNSNPLTSRISSKNYVDAFHPDNNSPRRTNSREGNTDIQEGILKTLPQATEMRLRGMSRRAMLEDPEYIAARTKFIEHLSWGENYTGSQDILNNQILYTPDDLKHNEGKASDTSAQPIIVGKKPMEETMGRYTDGNSLLEVVESGDLDDIITFNSLTQRLYSEIIRPLTEFMPVVDRGTDRSARVFTAEDLSTDHDAMKKEAQRLTAQFNGYDGTEATKGIRGISEYIYISKYSGWKINVEARSQDSIQSDLKNSVSVYEVSLVNQSNPDSRVILGKIEAHAKQGEANSANVENAKGILKELLRQCTSGVLKGQATWQVPMSDVKNLTLNNKHASNAKKALASFVDDGIFELFGSSLQYTVKGITLYAPLSEEGRILYPYDTVTNSNNACLSAPVNTSTEGQGAIVTGNGTIVEEGSGAIIEEGNGKESQEPLKSEAEKKAEALIDKIVYDSGKFILSEDETYYYIEDQETGQRVKYLRVTTVIGADESIPQYYPSQKEWADALGVSEFDSSTSIVIQSLQNEKDPKTQKELFDGLVYLISTNKKYGVSKEDIIHALGEIRTKYKKEKFGAWGVPSTAIGNTADIITRDFLAGELKEHYPNVADNVLADFVSQLKGFKMDLNNKGIKIVSKNVMAHGKITVTAEDGSTYDVNVAGTLDLLGYDGNGNFYIFDMKTTRDHSSEKLLREKSKWSRQLSMYADLLSQSYPEFNVTAENLRIIPIDVDYPAPRSKSNTSGPLYSVVPKGEPNEGQLQRAYGKGTPEDFIIDDSNNFAMRDITLEGQFSPGHTTLNIVWDNLSAEDQEIANVLKEQSPTQGEDTAAPSTAEIQPSQKDTREGTDEFSKDNFDEKTLAKELSDIPPVDSPSIDYNLVKNMVKEELQQKLGIQSKEDFNKALEDPVTKAAIENILRCL